jgi:hypothetical protein
MQVLVVSHENAGYFPFVFLVNRLASHKEPAVLFACVKKTRHGGDGLKMSGSICF